MNSNKKGVIVKGYSEPIIDPTMKSHANDPYFVEKLEKAKETLKNAVFPVCK